MLKVIFACFILLHGLIHIMGFLKAFRLAEIEALTLPISKPSGVFWLLACLLLIGSAAAYLLKKEWWWMVALVGVVISQGLIFVCWQDAKFGTIANVIILIGCILGYGSWSFNHMVENERNSFSPSDTLEAAIVTDQEVETLPPVVQRWMERVGVIGNERQYTVQFKQSGRMKTSPDSNWMPVNAEQYVKTVKPGFLWIADVKAAPFVYLAGRDKYADGKGAMLIKLMSLIPVADSQGPEIDQGALLRYLAEMVWYPSAALEEYITWEEIDDTAAKATMNYGTITASGIFKFNERGLVKSFEAERYYDRKEGATPEDWCITIDENSYREFERIMVPTRAEVTWKLKEGDFTWYKLEVAELTYNTVTNTVSAFN